MDWLCTHALHNNRNSNIITATQKLVIVNSLPAQCWHRKFKHYKNKLLYRMIVPLQLIRCTTNEALSLKGLLTKFWVSLLKMVATSLHWSVVVSESRRGGGDRGSGGGRGGGSSAVSWGGRWGNIVLVSGQEHSVVDKYINNFEYICYTVITTHIAKGIRTA